MLILIAWWCVIWIANGAVLDPALYLLPSPPMNEKSAPWTQKRVERNAHDLSVVPIQYEKLTYAAIRTTTLPSFQTSSLPSVSTTQSVSPPPTMTRLTLKPLTTTTLSPTKTTENLELMDNAETFWPLFRTSLPYVGIHVPLSFRLSGTYGYGQDTVLGSATGNTGVISTSYVSTPNKHPGVQNLYEQIGLYGKSGLAGSSYGSYSGYGTRIYGSQGDSAWSGWGNGKWGHYGKG
ncbi:uncharacterized protein LOC113230882 [Hyposmocoma kahamanoa]|uniref:uncharacterized protein LOC113230882 n=1 Tax=Hyposmocoma kahamanoa TaxID=1477025 RepID=UPI000E6DA24A|nr:uncharacterized protein LOC113230882 [Hyposmocoma kahamanoa]